MKYIKTMTIDTVEEIFVFPTTVDHDMFAEGVQYFRRRDPHGGWKRVHREIMSAGFVSGDLKCYGKSETLGLESDPEVDTELLNQQFNG